MASKRVVIVDAMEVVQSITKTTKMTKVIHFQQEFLKRISKPMKGYDEGRIVFDKYLDQSLKNKTQLIRSKSSAEYAVHPDMSLTMSFKDLLSTSSTKRRLTVMLAEATLDHFIKQQQIRIIVVYDDKIRKSESPDQIEFHTHEEADTLIPQQVLDCQSEYAALDIPLEISVGAPDTDVLTLNLHLDAQGHLKESTKLLFITGKKTRNTSRRIVDKRKRVKVLGTEKSKALIGFHNFTGADWGASSTEYQSRSGAIRL